MILKRIFDLTLAFSFLIVFFVLMILIWFIIKLTSKGPGIYWSKRVGQKGQIFLMPKFRTMKINTPAVATHLLTNANDHLTHFGSIIRKTSLDELPQLWSIIIGDMSFVGPRPALYNQKNLIYVRKKNGIDILKPGLTGWAQINGRDDLSIKQKVYLDLFYLKNKSIIFDIKIILLTIMKVITKDGISH